MADSSVWVKAGAAAAGAAALGFFLGKKAASKGPASFVENITAAKAKIEVVSPEDAKTYISTKKPLIIDVRDSGDSADAIKGAVNIPLSNLFFAADQGFALPADVAVKGEVKVPKGTKFVHEKLAGSKDQPILVSCGLGGQAVIAAGVLADYGFTQVKAVDGGNMAWMNASGEVCDCLK
mmetsp:Transcript_16303/g.51044  ORF Transcript_16303/g.51044 Transcript_16303/m.51044 type:complete len:179 (+) Transcript_16303:78-614(+)